MLIAYEMTPQNLARFEFYENAPDSVFCPACRDIVDPEYVPQNLAARAVNSDMVFTRDGHDVTSQKFRDFCHRIGIPKLDLIKVNETPLLYDLRPRAVITYDVDCGPPRFENKCSQCGRYESVIGPKYSCLKGAEFPILEGIYRTDLEFASGQEKHPIIIVGLATAELIKKERFRGIVLNEIHKEMDDGKPT